MQYAVPSSSASTEARKAGARRRLGGRSLILASAAALAAAVMLSLSVGATEVTLSDLPRLLLSIMTDGQAPATREALILFDIRLPRTLLAMFVGAALALSGAMLQGLFRNPLADPGIIGISSGAALAAVSVIAFGDGFARPLIALLGIYALPVAAFLGGMAATVVLVALTGHQGKIAVGTLLLAGVALAALAQAMMGLVSYLSDERELRDLTLWTLGSFAGASWAKVAGVVPFALLIAALIGFVVRGLNGLVFGEAEAFHLGIDVERVKRLVVVLTAAAVGAAVAVAGIIGFVGIVVPHLVRLVSGPDHRIVLPASALLGATLALVADTLARTIVAPAELPVGIIMAIIGGPLFLHLVLRRGLGAAG